MLRNENFKFRAKTLKADEGVSDKIRRGGLKSLQPKFEICSSKIVFQTLLYIFLLGIIILLGAIILNIVASRVGFLGWYDFLKEPGKANLISYIWLFILYPLGLGVIAYFTAKFLNI